jgi:hypothetical protein
MNDLMQLKNVVAKNNYQSLFDYNIVFELTCVLPMLELVQNLSNMAQGRHTFCNLQFCDFNDILSR